jgi:phytoene dehydrogenase-like protein
LKLDCSLDGPIPWTAPEAHRAGTVHIGGTLDEVAASERAVASGRSPEHPYVLVVQPSAFDPTRAPEGIHTLWAYCHVPNGSQADMTATIEAQLERFAPGYGERVRSRSTMGTAELEAYNPNYRGGDINAGAADLAQVLTRPRPVVDPYRLPLAGHLICSASTPPGGGVHGMCGYWAARSALRAG